MIPAISPLSIAVVGLGGIGSTFAYQLAQAGHRVTAVARPASKRLAQLERDQAIVLTSGERAPVQVAGELDAQAEYDLVIVTALAHQVEGLLPTLARSHARALHLMFNVFDPERFASAIGAARCSFGMPFVMATLDPEGKLQRTISASRKTLHGDPRWVALFNEAGVASELEPQMALWLRCHVPVCLAMESIAYTAELRKGGATWAEAARVARGMRGGFAIVEGLGDKLYPAAKRNFSRMPVFALAGLLWFLSHNKSFRELLATGINECRALGSVLTAAGSAAASVPQPAVEAVRAMIPAATA